MFKQKCLFILALLSVVGCNGGKSEKVGDAGNTEVPSTTFSPISLNCPAGYVAVPFLTGYSTQDFCVAKYEMKNNSGAKSEAVGTPWSSINRSDAIAACSAIGSGYSLITHGQQETIARNVHGMAINWSNGTYDGAISGGHTDAVPFNTLAANSDDAEACHGTGQTCSNSVWSSQRRTLYLSTGSVIWDFAGNVWEWAKDDKDGSSVLRGGSFGGNVDAGNYNLFVFSTRYPTSPSNTDSDFGFRCVYQP